MKKNAETAAKLIQQAIRETGSDFALSNARSYLVAAFNELTKVHNKRERRNNNFKIEEEQRQKIKLTAEQARLRLLKLDEMLKAEEAKLNHKDNLSTDR